ncbi:MAG: sulfotransferase domain-containing protein [Hyphomicrobiaceae bacterium]
MGCKVDFFIVGVQKGGTTALDTYLRQHTAIQMARVKEVHHFDNEANNWLSPDHNHLHGQFEWNSQDVLRGEATPIYTYWPEAIARLHRYNPSAKLLMLLRHPSLRAHSHWQMEHTRRRELLSFEEAISDLGRRRMSATQGIHRIHSFVERGFYAEQIKQLLEFFPKEQICFLRTDALWREPGHVLETVETFLGIAHQLQRSVSPKYIVPERPSTRIPMPKSARAYLDSVYAGDIEETSQLTQIALSDWLDPSYVEPMQTG